MQFERVEASIIKFTANKGDCNRFHGAENLLMSLSKYLVAISRD